MSQKANKTEGLRGPGEPEFATLEKTKKDSMINLGMIFVLIQ